MPYSVGNLIEGHGMPLTAHKNDPIAPILNQMIEHDYSQIPIVDANNMPLGMVTYESILRGIKNFKTKLEELHVKDVMVDAPIVNLEDDLFDLLDRLKLTYAALIIDIGGELVGIATSYDTTEYFRSRTEDLMRVEDIEITIKEFIKMAYTNDQGGLDDSRFKDAIGKAAHPGNVPESKQKNFDDLTLGEYINLLVYPATWKILEPIFGISKVAIKELLDNIRKTRNDLAHFRHEISADQQDQLRFCADWLARQQEDYHEKRQKEWIDKLLEQSKSQVDNKKSSELPVTQIKQILPDFDKNLEEPGLDQTGPKQSRYSPLADWLSSQPGSHKQVTLSFEDIEKIIGGELPGSAHNHRAWWANDSVGHPQSKEWLNAGWRTTYVNISEGRVTFARIREREKAYIDFFNTLIKGLSEKADFPVRNISPGGSNWIVVSTLPARGMQLAVFGYSFSRDQRFRVELYIDTGDQIKNKQIFDLLKQQQAEIEIDTGQISWERLDEKKASRIAQYHSGQITDKPEELSKLCNWGVEAMIRFNKGITERVEKAIVDVVKA